MIDKIKKFAGCSNGKTPKSDYLDEKSDNVAITQNFYIDKSTTSVTKTKIVESVLTRTNVEGSNIHNKSEEQRSDSNLTPKNNNARNCNPNCPCWGQSTKLPRICPICGFIFKKNWWGIDAHYEAHKREGHKDAQEEYQAWRSRMCDEHKPGK